MTNRPSVTPAERKMQQKGGPKTEQVVLWARFPFGAGSSHTEEIKHVVFPACILVRMKKKPQNIYPVSAVSV